MAEKAQAQVKPAAVPTSQASSGSLQRKCACGTHTTSEQCDSCKGEGGKLRRKLSSVGDLSEVPSIVHDVLRSPGQPLDSVARAFFEPRFGHDLSHVRVHTDAQATESARTLRALAYTVGSHVTVRSNEYTPNSPSGFRLLAHELAHVVQQAQGVSVGDPESRADLAAKRMLNGQAAPAAMLGGAKIGLYRQRDDQGPARESVGDEELAEFVRRHFAQAYGAKSQIPAIPATSPLSPNWKSPASMSMLTRERQPEVNLRLPSPDKQGSSTSSDVPAGINPLDPSAAQKQYGSQYVEKWAGKESPTSQEVMVDYVKEQAMDYVKDLAKERFGPAIKRPVERLLRRLFGRRKKPSFEAAD